MFCTLSKTWNSSLNRSAQLGSCDEAVQKLLVYSVAHQVLVCGHAELSSLLYAHEQTLEHIPTLMRCSEMAHAIPTPSAVDVALPSSSIITKLLQCMSCVLLSTLCCCLQAQHAAACMLDSTPA